MFRVISALALVSLFPTVALGAPTTVQYRGYISDA
jgi:hypothetical protein